MHSYVKIRRNFVPVVLLVAAGLVAGCSGGKPYVLPPRSGGFTMGMPQSISPAFIKPAPMAKTTILPSSAMKSSLHADAAVQGLAWSQIPGTASQVAAAPDGSIWVLSDQPSGADKYIWHYSNGTWTNISGMASHLAVARSGNLYAINSGGGTYLYNNGSWTALGGGASALTAAADGSVYVLSNGGSAADKAIWHNVGGTWTQMNGAGTQLAASWDTNTYTLASGAISPGGLYVLNSVGGIYYENTGGSFATLPGDASAIAAAPYGGVFALSYPSRPSGNALYYYNLSSPGWTAQLGSAISISQIGGHLYAVSASGAIYSALAMPALVSGLPNVAGPYGDWSPYDVANAFQFPVQSGYDGTGQTVAIVIDAVPLSSDLAAYLSHFNITRGGSFTIRSVDGGGGTDAFEATLDADTISGLAPGANVILYDIPDLTDQHMIDAYNAVLSDGEADVVSASIGECEYRGINTTYSPIFAQMAAQGIAAVAASFDWGNECYQGGNPIVGANYPASDPSVIGVGGTETNVAAGPSGVMGRSLWNDCPSPMSSATLCMGGGGVSGNAKDGFAGFAIPSYQVGLSGEASSTFRNVPDISMPADNDSMYMAAWGSWGYAYGTSWSAPEIAALVAELYEYCGVTAVQEPVKLFYDAFASAGYNDFLDVTSGSNQFMGTSPFYTAHAGYDNASGIGLPLGIKIGETECPNHVLSSLSRVAHMTQPLATLAPARARVLDDVPPARGFADLGERANVASTRIAIVLRATPSLARDEQTVVDDLQSAGFTIVQRYANHLVVDAQAPAVVVERYFSTHIDNFEQDRYGERYANVLPLVLPAPIAPYVSGVVADNLVLARAVPHRMLVRTGPAALTR